MGLLDSSGNPVQEFQTGEKSIGSSFFKGFVAPFAQIILTGNTLANLISPGAVATAGGINPSVIGQTIAAGAPPAVQSAVTNAVVSGSITALSGGDAEDVIKNALIGGATGAIGEMVKPYIQDAINFVKDLTPEGLQDVVAAAGDAGDVAGSVADVDVSAGEFFDEPFIGDELLSPTNLDNAYASLSDYGRTVYDAEIALGSTPEMAYIRAARANAMYFPETGNALATGGAAAAGNALSTDQTPFTQEDLSPNVGGAIDFTQGGAAVTPPGGVATVDLTAGQTAGQTAGAGTVADTGAGFGATGTAAGVAGAGAAAAGAGAAGAGAAGAATGAGGDMIDLGADPLYGGAYTGSGAAESALTGATAGAAAGAAGLTGIPVVDDFLKYLGTPAGAAALGAFGSLASGYLTGQAAKDAAQIQAQSAQNALALQREQFEYQKGLLEPYRKAGESALGRLTGAMGLGGQAGSPQQLLEMDPGYAFRLGEGMKALERVQAARGNMLSGGAIKAGQRYAQDFASGEYGNAYNRLANIAGLGQTVGGQLGSAAQQFGQTAGDTMSQSANALAAGRVGRMSGYMGGIGGAVGAYQNYQNQQQQNQLFRDIYGRMGG
jgi:hypothetical protein